MPNFVRPAAPRRVSFKLGEYSILREPGRCVQLDFTAALPRYLFQRAVLSGIQRQVKRGLLATAPQSRQWQFTPLASIYCGLYWNCLRHDANLGGRQAQNDLRSDGDSAGCSFGIRIGSPAGPVRMEGGSRRRGQDVDRLGNMMILRAHIYFKA